MITIYIIIREISKLIPCDSLIEFMQQTKETATLTQISRWIVKTQADKSDTVITPLHIQSVFNFIGKFISYVFNKTEY